MDSIDSDIPQVRVSEDENTVQSRHPPSHPQCHFLASEATCDPCSKLESCESAISDLEDQLRNLRKTHRGLLDVRNSAHDTLTSRLPLEIISQIFVALKPFSAHPPYDLTPFVLGSVCRAWRNVVLSTPELWATIFVDISKDDLDSTLMQFQRAQEVPLAVRVYASAMDGNQLDNADDVIDLVDSGPDIDNVLNANVLIDLICSHVRQIKALVVATPSKFLPFFNANTLQKQCILDELYIDCGREGWIPFRPILPQFDLAKKVVARKVCTRSYPTTQLQVDWTAIRNLHIVEGAVGGILAALAQPLQVSELVIDVAGDNNVEDYPQSLPVVIASVKTLTVYGEMTIDMILPEISTPSVTAFYIRSISTLDHLLPSILNYLNRSSRSLTELSIEVFADFDYSSMIAIFNASPNLTNLTISHLDGQYPEDAIFDRLAFDPTSSTQPPILLRLNKLHLETTLAPDWNALLRMLELRQRAPHFTGPDGEVGVVANLDEVTVTLVEMETSGLEDGHLDRIAALQHSGCSIEIKHMLAYHAWTVLEKSME